MSKPITKRVLERKNYNCPLNKEVALNADGSGGPIISSCGCVKNKPTGSPLKKKDACYHKAKAKYDVFPSAYASGYIAKCRKKKGNIG